MFTNSVLIHSFNLLIRTLITEGNGPETTKEFRKHGSASEPWNPGTTVPLNGSEPKCVGG